MKTFNKNTARGLALSVSALALVVGAPALAQDAEEPAEEVVEEAEEEAVDITTGDAGATPDQGAITVTGSRIRKSTFNSISPLQVITTDQSSNVGAFDPAQILQRSESAAGVQIDATFQGFVLDNGPGSETINLRGLGADRTLLLINGRRLAPAGVEGAPTNPSINLLPASLIDRYDLLLDGASSVYGSDAVAGVGNIILRKDFDGLELFASGNLNEEGGGNDYTVSAAWGFNTDRAFFGIGGEYRVRDEIRLRDRSFLSGCETNYEIDQNGNVRTVGVRDNAVVQNRTPGVSVSESPCVITGISGRIFIPFTNLGSVYYQNGNSNTGIPNFNESTFSSAGIPAFDVDANGDGIRDVDFQDVNTNAADLDATLISQQKLYNVMAYGEYTFPGAANITPFFEALYTRAEIFSSNTGTGQVFPSVPDLNAFNPCNFITNPNGVDCRAAENATFGSGLGGGFALPVSPIFSIRGDRNNVDVTQEQYRGVLGVRGDLPFIGSSWTFEASGVYSRSEGSSIRTGIREDKLAFAIGLDPTADYDGDGVFDNNGDGIADDYDQNLDVFTFFGDPQGITACDATGLANPDAALGDLTQGCVPVNLFADSVLGQAIGDFETQAERDYLFGVRSFDTTYEQTLLSAFVTGDLFELPAGPVGAVFGAEYRKDSINSTPNDVASNGLFFAFFADRGAIGSKEIKEVFGEVSIPLQADKPWVRELSVDIAGRVTDEEFYGTNATYSIKGGWRPIDSLLFKVTYGTSFRAPNLRENFLAGQTGFPTVFDPCAVPDAAFVNGAYDASLDTRESTTLDNCIREGRDPTVVGIGFDANDPTIAFPPVQTTSAEAISGGTLDLDPETSRSITAGFAFEETFGDGYDVALNLNYYDIKVKDSIIEPSSQFIINDCFTRDDGIRSQFCDRLEFDTLASTRLLVSDINSGFINLNQELVRGLDINADFSKEVTLFGNLVDLGIEIQANHLIERSNIFIDDSGVSSFDEDAGEFGFPKWTGRATFTAEVDKFLFTWQTRYVGPVEQSEPGIDPLSDAFGNGPDGVGTGFLGNTCLGGGSASGNVAGDGIFCRDVGFANAYYEHAASIRYRDDSWTIRLGVTNIFDRAPPLVDCNEGPGNFNCFANRALGNAYSIDGREFFASVRKTF
ncbi:MAG: TonB-dependent receptor [Erythrobacter sp.]